jgi:fructokinase
MGFKVIGIGEVLWDLLPSGPQLGGAPANFACHAHQLGAEVQVITRIGNDILGRQVLERFSELAIGGPTVQSDEQLPTGTAGVSLDSNGTPQFTITEPVAWDWLALTAEALEAVRAAHAVCCGSLAQRAPAAASVIQQLVAATSIHSLRVFDINLRQAFYTPQILERSLQIANVLKLNDQELEVLSSMFGLSGNFKEKIAQLANRFDLKLIALTRAEHGSLLYQLGTWSELPGRKIEVVDTVGAGDAFTAALVMGLLHQFTLDRIHGIAAEIASFVCTCRGATPSLPTHLRSVFRV